MRSSMASRVAVMSFTMSLPMWPTRIVLSATAPRPPAVTTLNFPIAARKSLPFTDSGSLGTLSVWARLFSSGKLVNPMPLMPAWKALLKSACLFQRASSPS